MGTRVRSTTRQPEPLSVERGTQDTNGKARSSGESYSDTRSSKSILSLLSRDHTGVILFALVTYSTRSIAFLVFASRTLLVVALGGAAPRLKPQQALQ